jgi:hypothetical protein
MTILSKIVSWLSGWPEAVEEKPEIKPKEIKVGKSKKKSKQDKNKKKKKEKKKE